MLKSLTRGNQNQRQKVTGLQLGLRAWVVLVVGVWMVYQLRVFFNHKALLSGSGSPVKGEARIERFMLGRRGLVMTDSDARRADKEGEGGDEGMEEDDDMQTDEIPKVRGEGDDADDEELEMVPYEDPMEEIEPLDEDDEGGGDATTDQHSAEEEEKVDTKISEVKE